jgi:malonate transporter
MLDIVNLALPFFGLIFLGLVCGKLKRIPDTGLAWMNFFIVYVALPALFYRILAKTPLEQLTQVRFIVGTTLATFSAFCIAFAIGLLTRRGDIAESTIAGLAGSFGNIGYMGPGLALSTLGSEAAAPVALIFCFDTLLLFSLVPLLMGFAGTEKKSIAATAGDVVKRIVTNPFMLASALGALSAAIHFEPPVALEQLMGFLQSSAAPCALFVLGVTVALRPIERVPWEVPLLATVKLVIHPAIVLVLLSLLGPFAAAWMATAVLMAALPPALNVFVMARQYDTWVTQASGSVLFGTCLSVVTLTAVMWMVKSQALPLHLFH